MILLCNRSIKPFTKPYNKHPPVARCAPLGTAESDIYTFARECHRSFGVTTRKSYSIKFRHQRSRLQVLRDSIKSACIPFDGFCSDNFITCAIKIYSKKHA